MKQQTYLSQLFETAAEYGEPGRAAYHELEAHLAGRVDDLIQSGKTRPDAERQAQKELGEPATALVNILKADEKADFKFRRLFYSAVLIGLLSVLTFGLSAPFLPVASRLFGMQTISGDPPVLLYTEGRCEQYRALVPKATSCRQAAMLHHYYEMTDGRTMLIVLALLLLTGFGWLLKTGRIEILPRRSFALISSGVLGAFGVLSTVLGLGNLMSDQTWATTDYFVVGAPFLLGSIGFLVYYFRPTRKD